MTQKCLYIKLSIIFDTKVFYLIITNMDIKRFLREFPFISPGSIESSLGIPHGTIRLNNDRPIPEKYRDMIIESLSNYNPIKTHVVVEEKKVAETVFKPVGEQYIIKRVKIGITDYAYKIGRMEGKLFMCKNDIPDNTPVILG